MRRPGTSQDPEGEGEESARAQSLQNHDGGPGLEAKGLTPRVRPRWEVPARPRLCSSHTPWASPGTALLLTPGQNRRDPQAANVGDPKNLKMGTNKSSHIHNHSSTIHNSRKVGATQSPSADECIRKMACTCTTKHHSPKKRNTKPIHTTVSMNLQNTMLRSQTQRTTYCTIPFI